MDDVFIDVAGFIIGIHFKLTEPPFVIGKNFRDRIFYYYHGFLVWKKPKRVDYWLEIKYEDRFDVIQKANNKKVFVSFYEQKASNRIQTYYHISEMQLHVIVRNILQKLLSKNRGLIFHASAALVNGKAQLFLGKSGAGKSTITQLISSEYKVLADDILIIKEQNGRIFFYQTPFLEKSYWIIKQSGRYPIGKVFFLNKALSNNTRKLEGREKEKVLANFIDQLFTDEKDVGKQITHMLQLFTSFKNFYYLDFHLQNPQEVIDLIAKND